VPEQNGVAEHENRMVVELARSMLSVRVPKLTWAQACETAAYVLNRTGKNISYREISSGNVECSCDEETGSPTCVWHGVLRIHSKAVLEEV